MPLPSLPSELLEEILRFAIDVHPARHAIPRVNSTWANVSLPIIHSRISFSSAQQLHLFSTAPGELCCAPRGREVEVLLSGGTQGIGVWALIYNALLKCQRNAVVPSKLYCRGVRVLRLCLNTHVNDRNVHLIGDALCQVNPEIFVWTGPDPDHHFSTAIIPPAVTQLCEALSNWTSLRRLELSNIAFLNNGLELAQALAKSTCTGPVQIILSQAVFMIPISVLHIALGVPALGELRLIDVYQHSIWGPRLRMGDVEGSLSNSEYSHRHDGLERLRAVVSCMVKTERLMGGDREL
ncbi:hypothetical protein JB92DRAFT_2885894 [Gautieria morchelliformis]|nr:hypothetical protein JB92DRAFT_2885894 [Gautieria morchelliformis]